MTFIIEKDEATAGRRFVPFRLFSSNGTSPFTTGSGNTMLGSLNGAAQLSLGSVSVVSASAGQYGFQFTQSNVSTLGSWALYTDNVANFPQHVASVLMVNNNPFSTQSGVLLGNNEYSGVTLRIGLVNYSGATVGAGNIAPGIYSGASVEIKTGGIQTASYGLGNYSGVSFEVKSGGVQPASVGAGNYSGMSVEIKTKGIDTNSIVTATYSGVTFGISNIAAGTYSGVTIDGAKFLSAAGERSAASSLLSTNVGNSRLVQEYLWPLRNLVQISGSTMTVFLPDDLTSSWTASITTSANAVSGVDPTG